MCMFLVPESFQLGGVSERFNNRRSIGSCHKIILSSLKRIYSYLLPSPVSLFCIEICINSASLQRAFPFFLWNPLLYLLLILFMAATQTPVITNSIVKNTQFLLNCLLWRRCRLENAYSYMPNLRYCLIGMQIGF